MKKLIIRVSCLCLVLIMGLSVLASCGKLFGNKTEESESVSDVTESESNNTDADSNTSEESQSDGNDEVNENIEYLPERIDYNGATFKIVHDLQGKKQYIAPVDGTSMAADSLNTAFRDRNLMLQNYYNIKVEVIDIDKAYGVKDELDIANLSGEDFADAIFSVAGSIMSTAVSNGYVLDLNELTELNLEASYYDQRIQEEYLIEGKLFCIEGDFGVHDELRTHVIAVNKTIYDEFRYDETYGSPYELVRDYKWTLDLMLKMAKGTSDYASLGANMTKDSQWGIISESPFPYVVYLGTGSKLVETDHSGILTTAFADEVKYGQAVEILSDCVDKIFKNPEILIADSSGGVLSDTNYWTEAQNMFTNGQALFYTGTLSNFVVYANMEDELGLLPVPLYVEGQSEYYSWCSGMAHTPLLIPRTVEKNDHVERTANIVEGMAYFSKYMSSSKLSVHDAFYDKLSTAKLCRTADDYAMLELIFANKTYDIDYTLNLSGTCWKITTFAGTSNYSVPQFLESYRQKMTNTNPETNPILKLTTAIWTYYP